MAIYHCNISNVSRANGSSSVATLAYITGQKVHDSRLGVTYSYGRQERVLDVCTILPASAPSEYANPETLFNAIEVHETASNARIAKKIQVALPRELSLEEHKKILEDFIMNNLTSEGYCATYAIHDGGKNGNVHAHILVSNRPLNSKGQWECKSKKAYALDENGDRIPVIDETTGKQKVRIRAGKGVEKLWKRINIERNLLDLRDFLIKLRETWAEEVNKHLEPSQQIDARSNADRELDDIPTIHEGYAARAIESAGGIAERCEINRQIRRENEERREFRKKILNLQEDIARLEKEEREQNERLARLLRRREAIEAAGGFTSRERATSHKVTADRATGSDNQTAREIADRASRIDALIERRKREAVETRREREELERREREANEAQRRSREEREAKRHRNSRIDTSKRGTSR